MLNRGNIARSGIVGAMAFAFSGTMAAAGTITYTTSLAPDSTDWASALFAPQFHAASGTLDSVTILLDSTVSGSLQLSNTGTFADMAIQTAAAPGTPAAFAGGGGTGTKIVTGLTTAITSKLFVGEGLTGNKGIPAGTTIVSIDPSGTSIHISKNINQSGAKTLTPICTATQCSDWNLNYHAALPVLIPTDTINSQLSADVTLHVGAADTISLAPSASTSDTLDYGPKYDPATYDFTASYSGTPITLATAQALAPPAGIPAPPAGTPNPCALALYGDCTVDGHTYHTGVSHLGLSDTQSGSLYYQAPLDDLSMFIGGGLVTFPVDAFGTSGTDGGGNIAFLSATNAGVNVTVTYDFTAPAITRRPLGAVPEPMTMSLFGAGLAGLGTLRRRRKRA